MIFTNRVTFFNEIQKILSKFSKSNQSLLFFFYLRLRSSKKRRKDKKTQKETAEKNKKHEKAKKSLKTNKQDKTLVGNDEQSGTVSLKIKQEGESLSALASEANKIEKQEFIAFIDFENHSENELNDFSEILPILSYKLANFNYKSYLNSFNQKLALIKCLDEQFKFNFKELNDQDMHKKLDQNEEDIEVEVDFKTQLATCGKVLEELWNRVYLQRDYLILVQNLFDNFESKVHDESCLKDFELSMNEKRDFLLSKQSILLKYAAEKWKFFSKMTFIENESQIFVKSLPFNVLLDVLDRFMLIHGKNVNQN
jgi:hypothetical protein